MEIDKEFSDENFEDKYSGIIRQLDFTGTQIHYYLNCKRQLWYFGNHIQMEQESDSVHLGRLLHEQCYQREKKEIEIDGKIRIDFINKDAVVSEVKKSACAEDSHIWQLKYYLYYLKTRKKIENVAGKIHYPKLKKTMDVFLTDDDATEIERIMNKISEILQLGVPPKIEKTKICNKCAYFELCFI